MSTVLTSRHDGVFVMSLNRPEKLNAVNDDLSRDLRSALQEAESDPTIRALVLTGEGKGFCAGQDLSTPGVLPGNGERAALGEVIDRVYIPLIHAFQALNKPLLCYVNGVAAGAGMSLALACDMRMGSPKCSFVSAFASIGVIPDAGCTWTLPRIVGTAKAMEMAMFDEKVSAEGALQLGLLNWIASSPETGLDETIAKAKILAERPTTALGIIRQAFNKSTSSTLDEMLSFERNAQQRCCETYDFNEGVGAFLEKRKPTFKGI